MALNHLKWIPLFFAVLAVTVIIGCSSPPQDTPPAGAGKQEEQDSSNPGYSLQVFVNEELVAALAASELEAMPQVSLAGSSVERGPSLLTILDRAEVQDFSQVTAEGLKRGRSAEHSLTLNRREVTEDVILGLTQRGTTKLASLNLPRNQWVIDVSRILVEGNAGPADPGYAISIFDNGEKVGTFDVNELEDLPAVAFGNQEGPSLLSVLRRAGVGQAINEATVSGLTVGRRGPAELTLRADKIDEQMLLDFTRKGTVKLASPTLPREEWVLDVTRIAVR